MVRVLAFIIVCTCFIIFLRTYWIWHLNHSRRKGTPAPREKPTLFDVRELLLKGEKEAAVVLYRKIFGTNRRKAREAVDAIEKSIKS